MEKGKIVANRGIQRNKKPLQNILYWVEDAPAPYYEGTGVSYALYWAYEREYNRYGLKNFHGIVVLADIKSRLSDKQWGKFNQGERFFVKQRRIDGKNVKVKVK